MVQKIESYIRKHHMIATGSHVVAAVSGGADSVCLLLALLELREAFGMTVSAVHVEHGIRGAESRADAAFVEELCKEHGVCCRVYACDAPRYAGEHGMSEEEAGRHLRYGFFEEEKKRYEAEGRVVKIAVAHNCSDCAETVLFHLARGTGLGGLGGIAPVRGDIIRPLLFLERAEIEAYLSEKGQAYCRDRTNETDIYSRNRIRHAVLPALAQVNSRAVGHIFEAAQDVREAEAYLRHQAQQALEICGIKKETGVELLKENFYQQERAVRTKMLSLALAQLAGSAKDIGREHVRMVGELFARQVGRQASLPYGITAVRTYRGVALTLAEPEKEAVLEEKFCGNDRFSFRIIENPHPLLQISKKKYTKCFDYDKIKNGICVRNRLPGDYLAVNASGDRQKLKKYLVNEKIPAGERERIPLLADGAHIMWVVGYRISSYYKVEEHTKRILEVTFYGGEEDEGADSRNVF